MAYATGKYSYGLCDYCGQRYPYNVLRKNWRGFKVCPEDYEPKEPQLDPLKYRGDAIALCSLGRTGLSRWTFMLASRGTPTSRALEAPTTSSTCALTPVRTAHRAWGR